MPTPAERLLRLAVIGMLTSLSLPITAAAQGQSAAEPVAAPVATPAVVRPVTEASTAAARPHQGIPALRRTGHRLWAAWYGNEQLASEGPGDYLILASSDDDGGHWRERFHVGYADPTQRAFDPQLWLSPAGELWVLYAASGGGQKFDGAIAAFVSVIAQPAGADPQATRGARLANGVPGLPIRLRSGAFLIPIDVWRNPPARDAAHAGRHLYRLDPEALAVTPQGSIPDSPAGSTFDETTVAECADGSLLALLRVPTGLQSSRSTDAGRHWSEPAPFTAFATPSSRAQLRRAPGGALLLAFNDAPTRTRLSIARSEDCGRSWPHRELLDSRPNLSYPQLEFLDHGALAVIYDYNRTTDREIAIAYTSEHEIVDGEPAPRLGVVSRP